MANGIVLNLDTTKSEFQNPMIELRQGDGNYQSLDVTVTSNGEPFDLTGWSVTFMGTTSGGFKIVDGAVSNVDTTNGKFTYTPTKAWGQNQGEFKNAYFSFVKSDQSASSAAFRVNVLDAVDITAEEAGDYISIVDQTIKQLNSDVSGLVSSVNDLKSQNLSIKTSNNTWAGTNTFNKKIIAPAGVQGNADTATKLQTPRMINGTPFDGTSDITITGSGALAVGGVYHTIADLITANPDNGRTYITTDNGNWNYWNGTTWVAGGVYQSVGISDASVTPENLTTSIIPNNKKINNYNLLSQTKDLYIVNDAISHSGIVNVTGKFGTGSIVLFLLEKNDTIYTVKGKYSTVVTDGWHSLPTNFYVTGGGNEYIGVVGATHYSQTGGNGFYNFSAADINAEYFNTSEFIPDYDFSIFSVYENIDIVNKIENTIKIVNDQTNIVNDQTKILETNDYKNLADFTNISILKNFVNNKILDKGNVVANVSVPFSQTGKIYIVERDDVNFTVKKELDVTLTTGINTFDLNYETTGNGKEYLGVYAKINFINSGGNGYFETPTEDTSSYNEGDTFTTEDRTVLPTPGAAYNLALFAQYSRPLKEIVIENKDNIEAIRSQLPTIELSDYLTPKYSVISDSIGFVGRWFDTELNGVPVKATINEGSEFYFKVKNTTTINVNFLLNSVQAKPYFAYSIDGSPMTRQLITNPLLPTVDTSEHIVRVVIDGLTESEDKWIGERGIAFKDVTVDVGGSVTGIVPKNRKILFHGDSITEGIRVLNMNADSTGNSATGAFPYIASTNLNAISYRVGFGNSGVTKGGSGGVPELIQVIDKMTNARESPYIEPDLVVMNMGTNDSASTSDNFTQKLNAVLDRFTIKYSGTPIFVMVPFNQARKTEITIAVSARSNMYLVETEYWNITTTDGIHPNVGGGVTAGKKLAEAIKSVLGKDFFIGQR